MRADTIRRVGSIIFTHMVTPCWRQVMEHKTSVDTSCGQGVDLYHFSPTRAEVSPLVLGPDSSIDDPCKRRFSWLLLPCGPNYLNGRVWMLIEGRYYFIQHRQLCGYCSRADNIRRVGTIRGNIVHIKQ